MKSKITQNLSSLVIEYKLDKYENEIELNKTRWLIDNHKKMDVNAYDELNRLESILETDISGRDLILRLDLDVPLSPYTPPPPV